VSVNGYFAGAHGEQDWTFPYLSQELRDWITAENKGHDTIIQGETTYSLHKDYWPNVPVDQDPSAKFMNETPKITISKKLKEAPWGKYATTTILSKNVFDEVRKLKKQPGKNIVIVGSGSIVQQFTNEGLIDEYDIITLPIILSEGRPLFVHIDEDQPLKLLEVKQFSDGTVMHRYSTQKARG